MPLLRAASSSNSPRRARKLLPLIVIWRHFCHCQFLPCVRMYRSDVAVALGWQSPKLKTKNTAPVVSVACLALVKTISNANSPPNWFGRAKAKAGTQLDEFADKVNRQNRCRRLYRNCARKCIGGEKVTDPNSRNILLLRQATARAPNSDVFGLVQYPHKPHERGNSSNRYQKRECRYLPRAKRSSSGNGVL